MELVKTSDIPLGIDCDLKQDYTQLCNELKDFCEQNEGVGLSAVQVGLPLNLFVMKYNDSYRYFFNCKYDPILDEQFYSTEGCLSLKRPNGDLRFFLVKRYKYVRVTGYELIDGRFCDLKITPEDVYNVIMQHEIDHQNQKLISDFGDEVWI